MKSRGSLLTEKMPLTSAVIRYENMPSSRRRATVTQNVHILLSVTFTMSAFSFIFMLWDVISHPGAYTDLCGYHRSLSVSLTGWADL